MFGKPCPYTLSYSLPCICIDVDERFARNSVQAFVKFALFLIFVLNSAPWQVIGVWVVYWYHKANEELIITNYACIVLQAAEKLTKHAFFLTCRQVVDFH